MLARGQDGKLMVMEDGQEVMVFRNLENIDINWGISTTEDNFVGAEHAVTSEVNGPAKLTFRLKPDSPGFGRFVELRRKRAGAHATRTNVRFDITLTINYGDTGRERWSFPDVKIGDANSTVPGRTEHVTGTISATCDNPKRI